MDVRRGADCDVRIINLNPTPGQRPAVAAPMWQPAREIPSWVKARGAACGGCSHQTVQGYEERCELRPDWGCLGKARHRRDRECPNGLWSPSPP